MSTEKTVTIREPILSDIPAILDYWFNEKNRNYHLYRGTDPLVWLSPEREADAFRRIIEASPLDRTNGAAIVEVDGIAAGHVLLNHFKTPEEARMHFHMWRGVIARKSLGETLQTTKVVIGESLLYLFETYRVQTIVGEVAASNRVANFVLSGMGHSSETVKAAYLGETQDYLRYVFNRVNERSRR